MKIKRDQFKRARKEYKSEYDNNRKKNYKKAMR